MRYTHILAGSAMSLALAMGATAASAAEATAFTCRDLDAQVRTALETNQQSANHDQAEKERQSGKQYCSRGLYRIGVNHLDQALKLLGSNTAQSS